MGAHAGPGACPVSGADTRRVDRPGGRRPCQCGPAAEPAACGRARGHSHEGDVRPLRTYGPAAYRAFIGRALLRLVLRPGELPPVRALRTARPDRHPPPGRADLPTLLPERSSVGHRVREVPPGASSGLPPGGRDRAVLQLRSEDQKDVRRLRPDAQGQRPNPRGAGLRHLLRGAETSVRRVRRGRADPGAGQRWAAGHLCPVLPRAGGRMHRLWPVAPWRTGQPAARSLPLPFLLAAAHPHLCSVRP